MRTLRNAVERDRVHHAYLFVGSRGTGKTSMAKILARSLNCVNGPTLTPCGECESCRDDRRRHLARRDRDGRRLEPLGRRHPRPARAGRLRAGGRALEGLHPRRGAHAHPRGLERLPEDARGAAAEHRLRARDHRAAQGDADDRRPLPALRLPAALAGADRRGRCGGSPTPRGSRSTTARSAAIARSATGSFRDALGTLDQLVAYGGKQVATDDVLAVLGVADAELILGAADAIAAEDGAGRARGRASAWRARAATRPVRARPARPPAPAARDPDARRGARHVRRHRGRPGAPAGPGRARSRACALVRAIDELAAALAAIREGDEPRMTVELALLRAARPQLDPSTRGAAAAHRAARVGARRRALRLAAASTASSRHRLGCASRRRLAVADPPAARPSEPPRSRATDAAAASERPRRRRSRCGGRGGRGAGLRSRAVVGLWPAVVDQVRESGSELLSTVFAAARPVGARVGGGALEGRLSAQRRLQQAEGRGHGGPRSARRRGRDDRRRAAAPRLRAARGDDVADAAGEPRRVQRGGADRAAQGRVRRRGVRARPRTDDAEEKEAAG